MILPTFNIANKWIHEYAPYHFIIIIWHYFKDEIEMSYIFM